MVDELEPYIVRLSDHRSATLHIDEKVIFLIGVCLGLLPKHWDTRLVLLRGKRWSSHHFLILELTLKRVSSASSQIHGSPGHMGRALSEFVFDSDVIIDQWIPQ